MILTLWSIRQILLLRNHIPVPLPSREQRTFRPDYVLRCRPERGPGERQQWHRSLPPASLLLPGDPLPQRKELLRNDNMGQIMGKERIQWSNE